MDEKHFKKTHIDTPMDTSSSAELSFTLSSNTSIFHETLLKYY